MKPMLHALWMSLAVAVAVAGWIAPYRNDPPSWWPRDRIRIVYACPQGYVCFPAKDESRHVNTGLLPSRLIQTTAYRPSDYPPYVQAQQTQRKSKSSKK